MTCVEDVIAVQGKGQLYMLTKCKNRYEISGEITKIYLQNVDKYVLIDTKDLELIDQCTWYGKTGKWDQYARGTIQGKEYKMHRIILNVTDPKIHVDHINGNTYDNRRSNLRLSNNMMNHANQKIRSDNKTGFKGVTKRGTKYIARIGKAGKIVLGYYTTPEEAAHAYDIAAIKLYGEYAKLNF